MTTVAEALEAALQHHRAGRIEQAEQIYRQILHADPRHADAWHLLGVLAYQTGRNDLALKCFDEALGLTPSVAAYCYNRGLALRAAQKLADARASFEEAIRVQPDYANAHNSLGSVLCELSQPLRALAHFQQAVQFQPAFAAAHHNLGKALHDLGRLAEARDCYEQAIRIQPNIPEVHGHLGDLFCEQGLLVQAADCYERALALAPDDAGLCQQLADVLFELGRPDEGQACLERPLRRQIDVDTGDTAETGRETRPTGVPGHADADTGARVRAVLSIPEIFDSVETLLRHRENLERNLERLESENLFIADPLSQVGKTNFSVAYHGLNDRDLQARLAAFYLRAAPSLQFEAPHCRTGAVVRESGVPLRIGFVSSFFHMHTIGEVTVGLLRNLSRQVCRVILFRFDPREDPLARLIRESADAVVDLVSDLDAARRQIAEQRLDILFYTDIGMDPRTYFLAFSRLAPVQCVTWGHPDTTGIPTLDYYLSCADQEPYGAEAHYTERLVRLCGLPTYFYAPAFFPPAKTRTDFGLNSGDHLYVCPQAPFKLHPDFDLILGEILRSDPLARILFIRSQNPPWTRRLLRRFRRNLPAEADRIEFVPHQGGQSYLHLLAVCDALLDTTHFCGGNTTLKALSVGVPIVTLPGEFARSRTTYACYRKMGLLDCVAQNAAEYVQIALRLGTDHEWQRHIRGKILAANGALYENPAVVREMEQFFLSATS